MKNAKRALLISLLIFIPFAMFEPSIITKVLAVALGIAFGFLGYKEICKNKTTNQTKGGAV